jgi:myo-inositol-1(or 4)-monophosphatase
MNEGATPMIAPSLRDYLDFAVETAWLAGRATLGHFQTGLRPDIKADQSPVTIADRQAEELIRARIAQAYPGHTILGEEFGAATTGEAGHRWIVDPIDGTRAFVRGVPLYAVLIGLEIEGQPSVGVAYFPALGEMIAAATGRGCYWNSRPARVSTVARLQDGVIAHSDTGAFGRHRRGDAWSRLQAAAGFRAGWSDAYGYLLVATGRAELMLDPIMNVWDCAPFLPILQEAGGYFGDWKGNPTIHAGEALATTPTLLPEVLHLINGEGS